MEAIQNKYDGLRPNACPKVSLISIMRIWMAWAKYQKDLEKINFSDEDGPTKLLSLYGQSPGGPRKEGSVPECKGHERQAGLCQRESDPLPPSKIWVVGNQVFSAKSSRLRWRMSWTPKRGGIWRKSPSRPGKSSKPGKYCIPPGSTIWTS